MIGILQNWFFVTVIALTPLNPGGVGIIADIDSQLEVGHPYVDADKITHTHEGTHGINSRLRGIHRTPGFYLLKGKALVLDAEPKVTLADVANVVPPSVRGDIYQTYLVFSRRWWNEQPSYMFDELTGYTNGAIARKELGIKSRGETVQYTAEMMIYSACVPFASGEENMNLKESLRIMLERAKSTGAREFIDLSDPDCKEFIKFLQGYFGPVWTLRNFGV